MKTHALGNWKEGMYAISQAAISTLILGNGGRETWLFSTSATFTGAECVVQLTALCASTTGGAGECVGVAKGCCVVPRQNGLAHGC